MSADTPATPENFNYVCICFIVDDVVKSAEFYRDVLGFTFTDFWGEPPCFTILVRDGIQFFLSSDGGPGGMRPNRLARPGFTWDAYINCNDVDMLYAEFQSKGAKITHEREVAFYGMKEFEIEDCNGYRICFGEEVPEPGASDAGSKPN